MRPPIVLFAYARPDQLQWTLLCLKENHVPRIIAFSDAPVSCETERGVERVRQLLHKVDWCEIELIERESNLGLGKSILSGVSEVLRRHEAVIVFEDDLICVPGTYAYLSAALTRYRDDSRVMSVTGWSHPAVAPKGIGEQPYFDARAECWGWGTWARAWQGITEHTAVDYMRQIEREGRDPYEYGADLVNMAMQEATRNIWAVRLIYWHIVHKGLCLRPPYTLVQHIGAGVDASNVTIGNWCDEAVLTDCPQIPERWPDPVLNEQCATLWRKMCGARPRRSRFNALVEWCKAIVP